MPQPHSKSDIHPTERLLGASPAIAALRAQIRRIAAFDSPGGTAPTVLLSGETGTGKGLVARILHESGPRGRERFIEVNCAAIPEALLEAELFGFVAGAFTDAKRAKPGLFEVASRGTLFLDEIDALPLVLQGKLLTAIEGRYVRSLGSVVEHPVDVKLIAASQATLDTLVAAGRFRADLYFRLAVVPLAVPPLRARGADAVLLAWHYLERYAEAHALRPKRLGRTAEAWLKSYPWPGNVRELSHLMERVMLLHPEPIIEAPTLAQLCLPSGHGPGRMQGELTGADLERSEEPAQIRRALEQTEGNVAQAARLLGWTRKALRYRMNQHGITSPGRGRGRPSRPQTSEVGRAAAGTDHTDQEAVPVPPGEPLALAPDEEQKPVAVLALTVTFPEATGSAPPVYESWTVTRRWEQAILEKVQGFGGTLVQQGPCLWLAAFGLPHTLERLPHRALQAALALQHLAAEAGHPEDGAPAPMLRQAVHWGHVVTNGQPHAPPARLLALGEAFALPVWLLGQAAPGELVVSPAVAVQIAGEYAVEPCEGPNGEASAARLPACRVVGRSPSRLGPSRTMSRFVGRARELSVLEECWARVAAGRGQVVGLTGEAGVGKSRLLAEFHRRLAGQRLAWLEGRSLADGQSIPYLPVIDLLRAYARIDTDDDSPTIRAKLATVLDTADGQRPLVQPALLTLLEGQTHDPHWQALEPARRRQAIIDAVSHVLLCASRAAPLVMVVENLHWVDRESEAVLEHLIERLPAAQLLLLLTARPEYRPPWGHKAAFTPIRLDPLPPEHAEALLKDLLGGEPSLRSLEARLIARTEGNPFFLEESVRTLVEARVLHGARGAYRLRQLPATLEVPPTVEAVLAARLDRLPPAAKRLLQEAAVLGREVPRALLEALAQRPAAAIERGLAQLQAGEFLYETGAWSAPSYRFTHALTREVAYESLPPARRRALHARTLELLEQGDGEEQAAQVDWLAHHAVRGAAWVQAVRYCRRAGAKALAQSAYQEAAVYLEQALEALSRLPEGHDTLVQGIDLRLELRTALQALGAFGKIPGHLQVADTLAQRLADPGRQGWVAAYLSAHAFNTGALGEAQTAGQRALALAQPQEGAALEVLATYVVGLAALAQGDYPEALRHLGARLDALTREHPHDPYGLPGPAAVLARAWAAWGLAELGAFAESRGRAEEALRLAEAAEHPFALASALEALGVLCVRQGELSQAITALERGLAVCEHWQLPLRVSSLEAWLGYAYALDGRAKEALPRLERAVAQATVMGRVVFQALWVAFWGEAMLQAGQWHEAQPLVEQALALARTYQEAGSEAWALRLQGDLLARQTPPATELAEAAYHQAMTRADGLGMRPLLAHCHVGLGTLYRQVRRAARARTEIAAALELYRALGMARWRAAAEALLLSAAE